MAPQRPPSLPDIQIPSWATFTTPTNSTPSTPSIYASLSSTLSLPSTTRVPKSPRLEQPTLLTTTFYLDREQKGTADMLTRFRALVMLANKQGVEDDDGSRATREMAASEALGMEVESRALVSVGVLCLGSLGCLEGG